ncbi:hypothetical protein BT96DRAFT_1001834 [Gymnopus androsaceus JB14]|uniref:Uncharacterized protein n=1 Tax=Gymnopus androsaceus JB14 TaxID=1447944 RepID=A0A6A4H0M9_9AGAR|nr:hypothetical protein BT96DRAFT_1001834 [Gymnopus androsaceus JB14]
MDSPLFTSSSFLKTSSESPFRDSQWPEQSTAPSERNSDSLSPRNASPVVEPSHYSSLESYTQRELAEFLVGMSFATPSPELTAAVLTTPSPCPYVAVTTSPLHSSQPTYTEEELSEFLERASHNTPARVDVRAPGRPYESTYSEKELESFLENICNSDIPITSGPHLPSPGNYCEEELEAYLQSQACTPPPPKVPLLSQKEQCNSLQSYGGMEEAEGQNEGNMDIDELALDAVPVITEWSATGESLLQSIYAYAK